MSVVIRVENLGKRYGVGGHAVKAPRSLKEVLSKRFLAPLGSGSAENGSHIWALKNVSFDVHQGDLVGVVGRNGSGKTTLLKIISEVTFPTEGRVSVRGRLTALLGMGLGISSELSGRENIYLNGTILGMNIRQIKQKMDEIINFSELERFIDTPAKFYSSGMLARLGFSVAAYLDQADILIVDEALAAGDQVFRDKCLQKMFDITRSGRTVLFVSHEMKMIRKLTNKCVYLRNGYQVVLGDTDPVVNQYLAHMKEEAFLHRNE